jgi:pimeloyl-ACP methyl ester carboxylesterase
MNIRPLSDKTDDIGLTIRTYGAAGALVIVLHGGPGGMGSAAPLAQALADSFRVLEPWQRGSGGEPLTVARHVEDLHHIVETRCDGMRPALVGESWGAMLALTYAAAHPDAAGPLVLIGCGTFDALARAQSQATLDKRTDDALKQGLDRLPAEYPDPREQLRRRYQLTRHLYDYDPIDEAGGEAPFAHFDVQAHTETWGDMVRLQQDGVYPPAFAAIRSPVLMLHGAYDPHPGEMIRAGLRPHLPQLEYHEWERCGHSPWNEKAVRDEFYRIMRTWLARHLSGGPCKCDGDSVWR